MDEDFLDVTESGSKKIGFILFLIIVAIMLFGYFFVYQKFHFALKTVEVEVNTELSDDVNDYLVKSVVDTSGYELDISKVKTDEVGEYTYKVTYNKIVKKGKVKVVDTKAPVFETKELSVEVGTTDFYLGDFLTKCEDDSKPCIVTFKNQSDENKLNTVGTYDIVIVVSDVYDNKEEATVRLNVVEKGELVDDRTTDLEYSHASVELDNFDGEYYEKLDKAIDPDGEEATNKSAVLSSIDLEEYVSENYEGYTLKSSELIELYNKSNYIIGYAIRITIQNGDGERVVFVTK